MNNKRILIMAIGIFLLGIGIVITYMWRNDFTISETGTLGDGFNGLLAPFISFAGALLVFYSFQAQLRANKLQYKANKMLSSQWIFDTYLSLFREIEDEYNNISIDYWDNNLIPVQRISKSGIEAFELIGKYGVETNGTWIEGEVKAFENLKEPVEELIYLINEILKDEFSQKHFLAYKIVRFYNKNFKELTPKMQQAFYDKHTTKSGETLISLANLVPKIIALEKLFENPIR